MKRKHYIFLFFFLAGCSGNRDSEISGIELKELNGQAIDLTKYEGKAVFINFWATWCKPCIREMPTIAKAQEKLQNDNVVFLLASNEEPDQIKMFMKRHQYNFHCVHVENMEALSIQALPTTFIYNAEGQLKFSETGFRMWDDQENIDLITKIMNDL